MMTMSKHVVKIKKMCFILKNRDFMQQQILHIQHALHMFAESNPAKLQNETMSNSLADLRISIDVLDELPKNCRNADIVEA